MFLVLKPRGVPQLAMFPWPENLAIFDIDTWRRGSVSCWMLGHQKTSEVFQFKASVFTKDRNFVPFWLGILGSHKRTRCRPCGLEGNLVSSWTFSWWHFSGSRLPTLENSALFPTDLYVVLVAWKTRLQALPYRSNLYLKTCRLPIELWYASIKIHQVL